jgi:hypothetical protein
MFSLPQIHGNSSTAKVFTSPEQVFNPNLNLYSLPQPATFADVKWFFQSVMTRENLRNWRRILGGQAAELHHTYARSQIELLPLIPDDKLWTLAFTFIGECYAGSVHMNVYELVDTTLRGNANVGYHPGMSEQYTYCEPTQPGVTRLLQILQGIDQLFTDNATKKINLARLPQPPGNAFLTYLWLMAANLAYTQRGGAGRRTVDPLTRMDVLNLMQQNEDVAIELNEIGNPMLKETVSDTNRRALYNILSYSTNPCSLLKWPRQLPREHKPVLYGVELEVATDYSCQDLIDAQKELFFIAKQDGSISGAGRTKAELVTIPMSLRQHKKDWAHWFRKLEYTQFDCTTQTNNGQHVHIDKTAFLNKRHRDNFIWFFLNPCNKTFITEMSERTRMSMEQFSPLPYYAPATTLIKIYKKVYDYAASMRGTINVNSRKPTIEVRLFRGIVSYASMLKNLEFVDAVFHFTQDKTYSEVTLKNFMTWLNALPVNRYKVLRKYFSIMPKLNEHITASYVAQLVYSISDPQKICDKLNNSGHPLSSSVATLLNKNKRRTFVFNKKTGKIEVSDALKSKVAFLDRKLEALYTRTNAA